MISFSYFLPNSSQSVIAQLHELSVKWKDHMPMALGKDYKQKGIAVLQTVQSSGQNSKAEAAIGWLEIREK
jgi:hypothetical protein